METTYFDLLTLMIYSVGLSSESVACGVEVVLALLRAKEIADFTDGAPEGVDGPDRAGSQKGLQLCESHLDRIEVGAIARTASETRSDSHNSYYGTYICIGPRGCEPCRACALRSSGVAR